MTAADTTAEHAAFCRALRDRSGGLQNSGPFTPYPSPRAGRGAALDARVPGLARRRELGRRRCGSAARPRVRQHEQRGRHRLARAEYERRDVGADRRGRSRAADAVPAHERRRRAAGALLVERRCGRLRRATSRAAARARGRARNRRGASSWPSTLRRARSRGACRSASPKQLPESSRRTGRLNVGGPIVTAAGLVFIGASNDRRFRAFDSRTGAELWVTELPLSAHAVPITYAATDGRQYVAIVAAGRARDRRRRVPPMQQSLIAYALP